MRNLKKIIAVLVTLSMLLGAVALTATAADVTVTLTGRTQMEAGDFYFADLKVEGTTGGVQGTIEYDTDALEYVGVTYSDEFEAANADLDKVAAVTEKDGVITFVGLNPGNDKVWFTLQFTVTTEGTVAVGDAFDVKASNTAGTATVTATATGASVVAVAPEQVSMQGGRIRSTTELDKQDIQFEATIGNVDATIVEYGVIFLPAQLLPKDKELSADATTVYGKTASGKEIKAIIAKVTGEDLAKDVTLRATLSGSASFNAGTFLQVDMASRAYVRLSNGVVEYLYSNNDIPNKVVDGYARKSIVGIAKSMATYIIDNHDDTAITYDSSITNRADITNIIDTPKLSTANDNALAKALLNFLIKNIHLLPQA